MNKRKPSKDSNVTLQKFQILDLPVIISNDESQTFQLVPNDAPPMKKIKYIDSLLPVQSSNALSNGSLKMIPGEMKQQSSNRKPELDEIIMPFTKENRLSSRTTEDFFLKNENYCFYKCVLCSETIKSKPSYRNHLQTVHETDLNRYHTQKGFIDATKEYGAEFIQTDLNILASLTNTFDQIENIEKIVRDHKKRLNSKNPEDNIWTRACLGNESIALGFHREMIQRAFDMVAEKQDLVVSLQEEVAELLEKTCDTILDETNALVTSEPSTSQILADTTTEEHIKDDEMEPAYELYFVEDDVKDDGDGTDEGKTEKVIGTKRGRPRGKLARSLDNCLTELPEATAEYIRSVSANESVKYPCEMCGVTSKTRMLLCVHYMRVHFKIKNKVCPHCCRPFASQGDLTRHIRIHSGENPFKCKHPNCTSEFKTSGDLKKHKFIHERDPLHRPFECTDCDSKFARLTDFTRHKKRHLIGKVENIGFPCELCEKVFYRKDLYRAHWNHHQNIKPFECRTCLKRFAKKYDLRKHIDKQHVKVECDNCGEEFDSRLEIAKHFTNEMCTEKHLS